jgi:hypothetical protein
MLADVRRLIALRKRFAALVRPLRVGDDCSHLLPASARGDVPLPVPYVYFNAAEAVLVAGNPDWNQDAQVKFAIPFGAMGWSPNEEVTVQNAWQEGSARRLRVAEFEHEQFTILRDGTSGGGVLVLHLTKGGE